MKNVISTLVFSLTICFSSYSQTKKENINELLIKMNIAEDLKPSLYNAVSAIMEITAKSNLSNEKKNKQYSFLMTKISNEVAKNKDFKNFMENEINNIYDKNFSEEEIKELLVFYSSPVVQKLLRKQKNMNEEILGVLIIKYLPQFKKKIMDELKERKLD